MAARATITHERDGVWSGRCYLGTGADGRRIRPYRRFPEATCEAEARLMADAWVRDLTADGRMRSVLLRDVLDDRVHALEAAGASPHTIRTYRLYAERYVGPRLGGRMVGSITPTDIERLQEGLLEHGGADGAPLSPSTVRGVREMLSGTYRWLQRVEVCPTNPVALSTPVSPVRREAVALTPAEGAALMRTIEHYMGGFHGRAPAHVHNRALALAAWLALKCGLRAGEVCALRNRDISPRRRTLRVSGTMVEIGTTWRKDYPKSAASKREVHIDGEGMDRLVEVRDHLPLADDPGAPSSPPTMGDG